MCGVTCESKERCNYRHACILLSIIEPIASAASIESVLIHKSGTAIYITANYQTGLVKGNL